MAHKGWYEALTNALKQSGDGPVIMQLATIDRPSCTPRVRSLVHRGFLTASSLPTLPLILTTTDIRSPKVAQLHADRRVEVVYWIPQTQTQFRILGRASVVPAPGCTGVYGYPAREGVVYDALDREGIDWEAKRRGVFDGMSEGLKATWCRPGAPGAPVGEEEMARWPARLETEGQVGMALANFALVLVEPVEVDCVELGVWPERRTRFERDWEDEGVVEFKVTSVVP